MRNLFFFLVFFSFAAFGQNNKKQNVASLRLRAAVVKIDVTPGSPKNLLGYGARVSTGVMDKIYHKIIVLDDGVTQFYLVVSDFCVMSPSEYDDVAGTLEKQLGINPVNFWWSLSHTHSAPELGLPGLPAVFMGERYKHEVDTAYENEVKQKLIEGIIEARNKLEPAKLGVGWGFSQANINRRAIDVNGKASIGLNPDGPVDRRIGLIRLDKMNGSPLALMVNYPIHGTVLGEENLKISADVTGIVSEYVEKKTGMPVLFFNGAAGNLAPIYSVYPDSSSGHLGQFRVLLGDKILEANKKILSTTDSISLYTGSIIVETPRKLNLQWPDDMAKYTRTTNEGTNMVRLPIRFFRINDEVAVWSAPVELFCEISNEIRDRSPFPYTFYYGYTNGWFGYLPTEKEWKYGGYEVETVSPYTPAADKDLTESVVAYLNGEMKTNTNDGGLRLTAENGTAIGPEIKYMPEWRAFGWFTADDRVEWEVDVKKAGHYNAMLEWSVSNEEAGKEFLLEAKNSKLTGKIGKTGSWETYKTAKLGTIKLNEGKQTIIFRSKTKFKEGGLLDLRELNLVPVR